MRTRKQFWIAAVVLTTFFAILFTWLQLRADRQRRERLHPTPHPSPTTAPHDLSPTISASPPKKQPQRKQRAAIAVPVEDYNAKRMRRGLTSRITFANGTMTVTHADGRIEQLPCQKRIEVEGLLVPTRMVLDPTCQYYQERYR